MINSISVNGVSYEEPNRVKHEVFLHFRNQFKESRVNRPVLGGEFKSIEDNSISHHLVSDFTEVKVLVAIKESNGNKAPGPYGFNLLCYQKFWKVMKQEIMQFFRNFHNHSRLTYVLVHKLKPVMPLIISETQKTFIGGRNIIDGVFIANEVVDGWKKAERQGLIIKLDFEKAFDSVNWEFLFGQVVIIKRTLRCFQVLSGLRINYHKSVACEVCVVDESLHTFANLLNCKVLNLSLNFLGLPLGANPDRKSTWKPVIDNVRARLLGWMRKMLPFVGRLTLIKSVLSSLLVYYLSFFRMPEGVAHDFEKIEPAFLWSGNDLKRKVHLVKWLEVTKSVAQGGLGIRRIKDVNACLLLRWWWKFGNQTNALWRRVICSKYKVEVDCWHPLVKSSYKHSRVWKDIIFIGV
ncbi:uncharacterized protein LOC114268593 [Camellia sinensis]|uniref:uncharacterized protein LOC114268593 n=1 Tax=Camellia sinensis TaxID=4442 RepID=UPI00103698E8|nr:uncharacterized protein LOC114268593 [Camellia sinensis]